MKKVILFIFIMFLSLFSVACGDNTGGGGGGGGYKPPVEICKHEFFIVKESKASCMSEGMIYYECSLCGEQKQEHIERLDHEFSEWNVIYEATINSPGMEERSCKNCGEIESRSIPQLDHEHHYELINESEGSCYEDGYKAYSCECGDTYTENMPSSGHEFSEWNIISNADCFTNGLKERVCGVCGHREEETIVSKGHNIVNGVCTVCGEADMSHLTFTLNDDQQGYTLTYCNSSVTSVIVPDTYKGLPVTNIEKAAFKDCNNITSLTIPFVGGSIEPNYGDEMLIGYIFGSGFGTGESIYGVGYAYAIPSTLSEITVTGGNVSDYAFYNCQNLKKLVIKAPVSSIGEYALDNCRGLEEIIFPNTMETIKARFQYIQNLRKVDLSHCNELTYVAGFEWMDNLEEVILPDSVQTFKGFLMCPKLAKFNIPSSLTEISQGFLYDCPLITSVIIPDGVIKIGINAFYSSKITSISIPASVKTIEWSAFENCVNLVNVEIDEGVESIGDNAFKDCIKLKEVVLPSTLITMGDGVFNGCSSLEKLTIPFVGGNINETSASNLTAFPYIFGTNSYTNSYVVSQSFDYRTYKFYVPLTLIEVTVLGGNLFKYAFENCKNIEKIIIGENVQSIGNSVVIGCDNLQAFEFKPNSQLISIEARAFLQSKLSELVIPASVESIGDYAFSEMTNLWSVIFEEGSKLKSIGTYAFMFCTSLKEIVIPTTLETIGEYAFYGTEIEKLSLPFLGGEVGATNKTNLEYYFSSVPSSLKTVEISSGTEVPNQAFYNCHYIESIKLAASIEKINDEAFYRCSSLKNVVFEEGSKLKEIGTAAFEMCSSLTTFELPSSLVELAPQIFYSCDSLTSITIPSNVTSIGEMAFYNCGSLKEVTFEEESKLESLGKRAFSNCINLSDIDFADSIKTMGESVFEGCESLNEVVLPNSLLSLGEKAFAYCYNITSIVLPDNLEYIGKGILDKCYSLVSLSVPYIGSGIEKENSKTFSYFFDDYSSDAEKIENVKVTNAKYIASLCFGSYYNIKNLEFSNTIEEVGEFVIAGLTKLEKLTIPFLGSTKDDINGGKFTQNYANSLNSLKEITILYATFLDEYAFSRSCIGLEVINLPDMLEEIRYEAFFNCYNLKTVNFSNGLKKIGYGAFNFCYALEEIKLPESLEYIEDYAFANCTSLKTIEFFNNIISIGEYAFSDCSSLEEVKLPASLISLNSYTFNCCTSLNKVIVNESISNIYENAFANCDNLKVLEIPANIKKIDKGAFSKMSNLEELTLPMDTILGYYFGDEKFPGCVSQEINILGTYYVPEKLTTITVNGGNISDYAFCNLENVKIVNLVNKVISIGSSAFYGMTNLEELKIDSCVTSLHSSALSGVGNQLIWVNPIIKNISSGAYSGYIGDVIVIPSSVKTIEGRAFFDVSTEIDWNGAEIETLSSEVFFNYLNSSVTIPSSVKYLSEKTFSGYSGELIWNNPTIEKIGQYAFSEYLGTKLTIPSSVTEIENYALYNCINLEELVIPFVGSELTPNGYNNSSNVLGYIFGGDKSDKFKVVSQEYKEAYSNSEEETSIDGNLYKNYSIPLSLKKVTVTGGNVTYGAFSDCSMIQSIDVSACKYIFDYAFLKCSNLNEIKLPSNLKTISKGAFKDCISLTEFEVSSEVSEIREDAFRNCGNLRKIVLSENVDTIIQNAFYKCYNLKEVYNLSGLEIQVGSKINGYIAYYAKVVYESRDAVRDFITIDDKFEFYFDKENDIYSLEYYYGNDTELILPEYIEGKEYLIDDYAFMHADTLEKVTIPNTVISIGKGVFNGCENISDLVLPYVGENALYTEASEYTLLGYLFGTDEYNNSQLVYQFISDPEVTIGYYLPNGLHNIVINGGNILDGAFSNLSIIDSITILGDINIIGNYAFYNTGITKIDLPDSVQKIGDYAFAQIRNLNEIYLSENVSEIGDNAFEINYSRSVYYRGTVDDWCNIKFNSRASNPICNDFIYMKNANDEWKILTNIEIPSTITEIGAYQFAGMNGEVQYVFPSSISKIGKYAFCEAGMGGYDFWGSLDLSNTQITTIEDYAFADTYMRTITMPNTVTTIEVGAFMNNRYLEFIGLSNSIESVGNNAFKKCVALEELILPETVQTLGDHVFSGCNILKNVCIPASVTTMGASLFEGCISLESLHMPFIGSVDPSSTTYIPSKTSMLGYYFNTYQVEGMVECVQSVIVYRNSSLVGIVEAEYTYYIPESLKKLTIDRGNIANGALNNCTMLEEITHNGQDYYFLDSTSLEGCTGLKSLTLSNKVTSFEHNALKGCSIDVINYRGTKEEWSKVLTNNAYLSETQIIYNYTE